jgi:hypothetical protein
MYVRNPIAPNQMLKAFTFSGWDNGIWGRGATMMSYLGTVAYMSEAGSYAGPQFYYTTGGANILAFDAYGALRLWNGTPIYFDTTPDYSVRLNYPTTDDKKIWFNTGPNKLFAVTNQINYNWMYDITALGLDWAFNHPTIAAFNSDTDYYGNLGHFIAMKHTATDGILFTGFGDLSLEPVGITKTAKQIKSSLAIGTKPFDVTSTTMCDNLNADLLDGQHAAHFLTAETDPVFTAWQATYDAHDHSAGDPTQVDHANLTNVTTSQHHVKYTDAEAVAAVAAADDYVLNTGLPAGSYASNLCQLGDVKWGYALLDIGQYVGDGATPHGISAGTGYNDAILIKRENAANVVAGRIRGYGSKPIYSTADNCNDNYIWKMDSIGFSVGTDAVVNANGATYNYILLGGDYRGTGTNRAKIKTGTFVGTGAAKSISGLGFQPTFVYLKVDSARFGMFRTSNHAGTVCSYMHNAADLAAQGIVSLDADGFSVGTDLNVNENAKDVFWLAMANDAAGTSTSLIATGHYAADAVPVYGRVVPLPFEPDAIILWGEGALHSIFWTADMDLGDAAYFSANAANITGRIKAVISSPPSMELGYQNETALAYHGYSWIAFKE